jgi:hypothetical protein
MNNCDVPLHVKLLRPFETRENINGFMGSDEQFVKLLETQGGVTLTPEGPKLTETNMKDPVYKQAHADFHQKMGAAIPDPTNICDMPDIMGVSDVFGKGRQHIIRHPKIGWTGEAKDYIKQVKVMQDLIKAGGFALKEYSIMSFVSGYIYSFLPENEIETICGFYPKEEYTQYIDIDSNKNQKLITPGGLVWNAQLSFAQILKYDTGAKPRDEITFWESNKARLMNKTTQLTKVRKSAGNGRIIYTVSNHMDGDEGADIRNVMNGICAPKCPLYKY